MKKFLKTVKQSTLILLVIAGCLCFNNQAKVCAKKSKIQISDKKIYIGVYQNYKVLKLKGTKKKPKWSSSKKSVATIDKYGRIDTKKKGTTTITAKLGKKKYKCKVIVERPYITPNDFKILVGQTKKLTLHGTKRKVTSWRVISKDVASISSKGIIKGLTPEDTNVCANIGKESYYVSVGVRTINYGNLQQLILQHVSKKNDDGFWYYVRHKHSNNIYYYMTLKYDNNDQRIYVNIDMPYGSHSDWMYTFALDPQSSNVIVRCNRTIDNNKQYIAQGVLKGAFRKKIFSWNQKNILFELKDTKNLFTSEARIQSESNKYLKEAINTFQSFVLMEDIDFDFYE